MIYIFSAIIVVAVVALWAGYNMGYNSAQIDKLAEDDIDWDVWAEVDKVRSRGTR